MIIKGYIFAILYGMVCLGLALLLYKLGMPKKYSRKTVHILVGFEWVILYHYMGATYHFLIVCVAFLLLLLVAHLKKLMPMISSDSDNAPGTVYYALSMSIMSLITIFVPKMMIPFGVGVFCTSFGDGFAGVIGQLVKKFNPKVYGNKSLFGVASNFVFSTAVALIFSAYFKLGLSFFQCIAIGLLSMGLETVTGYGFDNVSTTLGTAFLTYGFLYFDEINYYIVPILITPIIIWVVNARKVLTPLGLAFAIILDIIVSLSLGNIGLILLLVFLVFSVIVDKIKKHRKHNDDVTKRSGECRDHIQVLANGLIPLVMAVLYLSTFEFAFFVGYVAALAEALADTFASGMGVYSKSTFDIFKMKKCKCGLSGGVSVIGTLSSLAASFILPAIALLFGVINLQIFLIAGIAAFVGTVFDTLLGSLLQIKFKCTVCAELTEKERHCDKPTQQISGFAFFDNDVVNLFSGIFAAVAAMICVAAI